MWDWLLIVAGLITSFYWYLTLHYDYWRSKGVYTLPGTLPGAGHMLEALKLKKSAGWVHSEIYRLTKGQPAVGLYSFRKPALLLRDLNLIKTALISEFSNFHDTTVIMDEGLDPLIGKNPFVLKGQRWKLLRQKLTPAFSPLRIKSMFPLLYTVCKDFNSYMEKHLNEDIDVSKVSGYFTSEVVAKCAFSLDGNIFNDPNAEFYQQGRRIWDGSIYNPFLMMILFYFPAINKVLRKSFVPKESSDFFTSMITQAAEFRLKNPDKVPDNDYLQFLLNLKNKDEDFSIVDVVAQSLTFFTDGFETSSVAASFMIYELVMNPEIQEAARKEVMAMEAFTYDNIISLPLIDRVFQETLRKYPVFSISRECTNDTVLYADGQTYPICKGQEVIVPVYGIHHDPEIYPNPEKFDPDRFLPENVQSRHPTSFMAFGGGPRTCIGYRFATSQVKILVANILANFKLLKCEKTVDKMKLSPQHLLPVSEKGIWVRFQKL